MKKINKIINLNLYNPKDQEALYEMQINTQLEEEIYNIVQEFQNIQTKNLMKYCYSLKEASKISHINRNRLSELFQAGILVGIRPGPKTLLIYSKSLEWYLKKMHNYQPVQKYDPPYTQL